MAHHHKHHNQEEDLGPSKSSLKRASHALQDLGQELVQLGKDQLNKVPLEEGLKDAIKDYQRFTAHEAKRRQLQYIGKLMRNVDPEPIRAALDVFKGVSATENARLHRLETLRVRLLEDEKVLHELAAEHPGMDLQQLRTLRRNALKEKEANKPPKAFREIFRILRELDAASRKAAAGAHDDADDEAFEDDDA
ncbi:ribosome biogenesis factor YjgA [Zoogloea sp.]|jgi:ribosome-associated protein|uniref:ribosome biogenesis factor YjgA n=1 Tax=Zoogloea sp. TaxID=49181 RepID=UPI0035B3472D